MTLRIISECDLLLTRAGVFEREVEGILSREGLRIRAPTIKSLQEIDILSQSIQSIALLLEAMQGSMSEDDSLALHELVARIPLRDMAMRLAGAENEVVSDSFTEF
ncbi:hypothetical protein SAMN06265370_113133 [Puniceibacterium sediminis]|uniref:Uncharacterized protein n=2 Tax=Puniceibacterium sediminis TaxID=1608407 RepID=A0A238XZW9_9RHOB|nr:hypothetical protein SAMN06265370_113133 [Puniceibacterium sediminis]